MTADRPFFVTTPIYYVNATPHLGHAEMRGVVDVINRGGDEKRPIGGHDCLQTPDMGRCRSRSNRRAKAPFLTRGLLDRKKRAEDCLLAIEVELIGIGEP